MIAFTLIYMGIALLFVVIFIFLFFMPLHLLKRNTQTQAQTNTHTQTHTLARIQTHTHTNTHAQTKTHTHTHNSTPLNHRQFGRTELHLTINNTLKRQTSVSAGGIQNFNIDSLLDIQIRNKC
jgi:ABC-type nickel/cobalt efflux system permease component RcnA